MSFNNKRANRVVVTDSEGRLTYATALPAVDGSALTGISGGGSEGGADSFADASIHVARVQAAVAGTVGIGIAAPTLTGTATTVHDTTGLYRRHATTAVSGNAAGWENTSGIAYLNILDSATFVFRTDTSIADQRIWVGMGPATALAATDDASTVGDLAMIRYSTAAGDTSFNFVTADNAAGATVTNTGVIVAAETQYTVTFTFASGSVACAINGVTVATHTTNLPTRTALIPNAAKITTLAASAKAIQNCRWVFSLNA